MTRTTQNLSIQPDSLPFIRKSFKDIATYSGNGCFIKVLDHTTLEISSYSPIAVQRAIAEIRVAEGIILRHHLDTTYHRPNKNIIVTNHTMIDDDLLTRIRKFVQDGCFIFKSNYANVHSVYIKANTQITVDLVEYIIQSTDLGNPIVIHPSIQSNHLIELFTNYTDTFDIIGKITNTSISFTVEQNRYTLQSNKFHSIEYASLLIQDFITAMENMKNTNDTSYITSYHIAMENLLGDSQ